MKHLVKLFLLLFVLAIASPSFGQSIGLKAGLNFSNQHIEDADGETISDDFSANTGFHVGLIAEFPLSTMFSFETGLMLTTKGFSLSADETFQGEQIGVDATVNLYYVDIPLLAKLNFLLNGFNIYGQAGPYVGYGLTGQITSDFEFMGEAFSEEEDINWGTAEEDDYRRLDLGLTLGAGVEFFPIRLGVAYDMGLANVASVDNGTINNRVFRISVAYMF